MASRHEDWLRQAKRDLELARKATSDGFHEWSCFAAQQSAEKAVKALYQKLGAEAWGHVINEMLQELPEAIAPSSQLIEKARLLDQYYIGPRYPNSVPSGMPGDFYTAGQAAEAILHANDIVTFCENHIFP